MYTPRRHLWESFWKGYLLWMNRSITACSSIYYFTIVRRAFPSPLTAEGIILLYSFGLSALLGKIIRARVPSGHEGIPPHNRDALFRLAAERTLRETFAVYFINTLLGVMFWWCTDMSVRLVLYGAAGAVCAFFSPFGAGLLTARNARTGRLDPALVVLGLSCIAPGAGYVIITLWGVI